ncbi:putative manganese transporter [Vibrio neptunius]|uniref:Manganese transporter n=1 Tax=Vibrio neptunius TaxID=170651 RepID=A0ABS3A031_9VIBR|nr:putative manganese transporter [Vibrio neptunius]MBN3493012.1 putative manganese transporter [Vibrio neptunius]MBN3515508.1 putative manganese transporter [Vibrio neptunius]MBN3549544.1 putative manganese transporter [Vibrio neptunius]MBN3577855.1 putative manganese transporter [Vibrio neptunius]MCH9871519.1 putative manganese transporter [Vibrio neptunius]
MDSIRLSHSLPDWLSFSQFRPAYKRLLLPVTLLALVLNETTREVTVSTLSDAFWAVSAYVAFTLVIYHYVSLWMNKESKLINLYQSSRSYQVFFAALLGALPGCGGAIIVTTQFVSGRVGFGAIVAVLASTMGDAAFLLLASKPDIGLGVVGMGIVVGSVSGWVVNAVHKDDFLRPTVKSAIAKKFNCRCSDNEQSHFEKKAINLQGAFWKWLIIPATVVAVLGSFQVDINQLLSLPAMSIEWLGAGLIILSMLLWSLTKEIKDYQSTVSEDKKTVSSHPLQKAAQDTNFVTAWVILAFMAFELIAFFGHIDLATTFSGWGVWMPMVGLAVGMLPGCGPQILVTSLYISGAVPLSAQLANAISNDGDALFPAIALAPKAALVASIYTAVPALLVGYSYYYLFEV